MKTRYTWVDLVVVHAADSTVDSLQKSATHPDVFSPNKMPFPRNVYQDMLTAMKLPLLVAETSAVVSPFFWTRYLEMDNETYLRG